MPHSHPLQLLLNLIPFLEMITTIFLCILFKGIIIYEHLLNLASSLCIGNGIVHCCLFAGLELHFHKLYVQSFHYILCLVKHLSVTKANILLSNHVQVNPHLPHLSGSCPCSMLPNSTRSRSSYNVYQGVISPITSCVQALMPPFLTSGYITLHCTVFDANG